MTVQNALGFDSTSDYLGRTSNLLNYNAAYTVMCWLYFNSFSDYAHFWSATASTTEVSGDYLDSDMMGHDNSNPGLSRSGACSQNNGVVDFSTGAAFSTGVWVHVTLRRSSGTLLEVFIDGSSTPAVTINGTVDNGAGTARAAVGGEWVGRLNGAYNLNGRLSTLKQWTRALSTTEIAAEKDYYNAVSTSSLHEVWNFPTGGSRYVGSVNGYTWTGNGSISDETGPDLSQYSSAITGTSVKTEARDTSVVTGNQPVQGATAKTEARDTSAVAGNQPVQATSAKTEAHDTSVTTGYQPVIGESVKTEAHDTSVITADMGPIPGQSVATEQRDTSAVTGLQPVQGVSVKTEQHDSAATTGLQPVIGESVKTEAHDTSVIEGTVGTITITGTSVKTEAPDTSAVTGLQPVQGTSSKTEGPDTSAIAGLQPVQGASVKTERGDSSTILGGPAALATSITTERPDSSSIEGDAGSVPSIYGFLGLGNSRKTDDEIKKERVRRKIIPPEMEQVKKIAAIFKPQISSKVIDPYKARPAAQVKETVFKELKTDLDKGLSEIRRRRIKDDEDALSAILELV